MSFPCIRGECNSSKHRLASLRSKFKKEWTKYYPLKLPCRLWHPQKYPDVGLYENQQLGWAGERSILCPYHSSFITHQVLIHWVKGQEKINKSYKQSLLFLTDFDIKWWRMVDGVIAMLCRKCCHERPDFQFIKKKNGIYFRWNALQANESNYIGGGVPKRLIIPFLYLYLMG